MTINAIIRSSFNGADNMGFNDKSSGSSDLIDRQQERAESELKQKTQTLYETKQAMLKAQGAQIWNPLNPKTM